MKLKLLIIFTLLAGIVAAQTKLVSYEYWFNNDYAGVQTVAVSPTQTHALNTNLDVSALPDNVNLLNIRYKDENGKYSNTLSKVFVKLPEAEVPGTSKLVSYEYWFNNDYVGVRTVAVSPAQTHALNTDIDVSALPNNVNLLNIRYKDENGKYSNTLSKLFVKLPEAEVPGTSKLVAYEYWFNNNYANVQTVAVSPSQTHTLNIDFDITALPNNVNLLNIRYKDENGKHSSTLSKLFVKLPEAEVPGTSKLVSYEYWFNNDYANVQTIAVSPSQTHTLNIDFDITALPNNVNLLNIRHKDENGKYSSTLSKLFVKLPAPQTIDNKLTDYMYWFDDDFENATTVSLPENVKTHNWAELLTLPSDMEGGEHVINIRYKDSLDMWSVPFTKAFVKAYNPRAEFDGIKSELCFGTMLEITPNAADADSIYWNFGDGTPIERKNAGSLVQHLYASAGTYTITATMKHTATDAANDTTFAITVHPTYGTFEIADNYILEDFETTTVGSLPEGWVLKYNGTGNANQKVVESPVKNGQKALQLEGARNWGALLYKVPSEFPDKFVIESWMQTNSTVGGGTAGAGSLSISNINVGSWGTDVARIAFNGGNITYYNRQGSSFSNIFNLQTYQINEWYHIKMNVDLTTKTTTIFINNQQVSADDGTGNIISDFPIHSTVNPTEVSLIAGNDGTSKMFFDNVRMYTANSISNLLPEVNLSVCASELPYRFGTQNLTTGGTYTETFQTIHGCDSIVTLNLTVNDVDVSVTKTDELTLKANAENASYQWVDCNNDNAPIEGETNQSFTATQNGSYAVVVTQNNCTDTSACYEITTVGIVENTFDHNITVYPNPTDGILNIDLGETLPEFIVSITDISGKTLRQSVYKNIKILELNLNVQPGFYLLTIKSENKKATIRLIKN